MDSARDDETRALRVGSSICQCGGCDEWFRSVTSFDKHRTGPGELRRCLTAIEMLAEGMSKNDRGLWITAVYDREQAA